MSASPQPPSYDQLDKPQSSSCPPLGSYPQQQYVPQPYTVQIQQPPVQAPCFVQSYFGESPVQITCTSCGSSVTTNTKYKVGDLTWIIFGMTWVFWFLGCFLFSWVPFCMKRCKDVEHTCPNCNVVLGRYKRLQ